MNPIAKVVGVLVVAWLGLMAFSLIVGATEWALFVVGVLALAAAVVGVVLLRRRWSDANAP